MRVLAVLAVCCIGPVAATGCGSSSNADSEKEARQAAARQSRIAAERRNARRLAHKALRAEERARHRAVRRKAVREAARRSARREAARSEAEEREQGEAEEVEEASECDPNYSGACLDPYASDYDCEGGSGDGPKYTGPVTVVGEDRYGLDLEEDGYACEP